MAEYGQEIKEQVLARIDIVELISEYIPLKKAGVNFKGLCPFHGEKTPSFVVSPAKQIFHCFGCHAGGDAFSFVMKHDSMTFAEAIEHLARKANVSLPEKKYVHPEQKKRISDLKSIYELSTKYYHDTFMQLPPDGSVRRYFAGRGYDTEVAQKFLIGYAPNTRDALLKFMIAHDVADGALRESGLFKIDPSGKLTDLFYNRLMFPIKNARGDVIAFGGRVLDDALPKYVNSPETRLF